MLSSWTATSSCAMTSARSRSHAVSAGVPASRSGGVPRLRIARTAAIICCPESPRRPPRSAALPGRRWRSPASRSLRGTPDARRRPTPVAQVARGSRWSDCLVCTPSPRACTPARQPRALAGSRRRTRYGVPPASETVLAVGRRGEQLGRGANTNRVSELPELCENRGDRVAGSCRVGSPGIGDQFAQRAGTRSHQAKQFPAYLPGRLGTRQDLVDLTLHPLTERRELVPGTGPLVLLDALDPDGVRAWQQVAPVYQLVQAADSGVQGQRNPSVARTSTTCCADRSVIRDAVNRRMIDR
jgi:hypothetical protein